jgi:hypothetical protein
MSLSTVKHQQVVWPLPVLCEIDLQVQRSGVGLDGTEWFLLRVTRTAAPRRDRRRVADLEKLARLGSGQAGGWTKDGCVSLRARSRCRSEERATRLRSGSDSSTLGPLQRIERRQRGSPRPAPAEEGPASGPPQPLTPAFSLAWTRCRRDDEMSGPSHCGPAKRPALWSMPAWHCSCCLRG